MFIFGIRRFQKAKKPINIGTKIIRFRRTKKPDTSFNCLYSSRDVKNKQANNFGTKINAFKELSICHLSFSKSKEAR